jgi:hypothetical protein
MVEEIADVFAAPPRGSEAVKKPKIGKKWVSPKIRLEDYLCRKKDDKY